MESETSNSYNDNFQNFIKIQNESMESFPDGVNLGTPVLQMDELFIFLENHFNEFHQKENFRVILAYIHRCLKVWISREDYKHEDIGLSMIYFMAEHRQNESDLEITIQIVYQIINSIKILKKSDVLITQTLVLELITMLEEIKCRTLLSNCIACIQLYMEVFPECRKHISTLWLNLKTKLETNLKCGNLQEPEIDILIQLIDDIKSTITNFHQDPILINTIQYLLRSDQRKYRKCGYYLLKKMFQYVMESIRSVATFWMSNDHEKQIQSCWTIYITILENLEEEQSHLILPSLENLKELIGNKYFQTIWLDIIYMRMLTHNNNLVLRWSIEFILKTFNCSELCVETLKYLLQATNSTILFNYEDYFLEKHYFDMFLKNDLKNLLRLLPEIENWKSLPLYIWLENIHDSPLPKPLTYEEILKISACVRKLQNSKIRVLAINKCEEIFKDFISKMTMEEYVKYVETLYITSDKYQNHQMFYDKKSSLKDSVTKGVIFGQRFYEIFIHDYPYDELDELLEFLNDVPVSKHGWLKFIPFHFQLNENQRNIIKKIYEIDLNSIECNDLNKLLPVFEYYLLKLTTNQDKYEKRECHQAAISVYIRNVNDLTIDDNEDTIRFILNSGINSKSVDIFAGKILENCNKKINLWFIEELIKYNNYIVSLDLLYYIKEFFDNDVYNMHFEKMHENEFYSNSAVISLENNLSFLTKYYFQRECSKGETRIEEVFLYKNNDDNDLCQRLHYALWDNIDRFADKNYIVELLHRHINLTKKKPRYFENSHEHRIKMRIAFCSIAYCLKGEELPHDILDIIWKIVLDENNHLNIVYIYEYILGKFETRETLIIAKLKEAHKLSAGQQVSILSVSYAYFSRTFPSAKMCQTIVSYFMALTMGANFQTSLLAQMSLYKLLLREHFKKTLPSAEMCETTVSSVMALTMGANFQTSLFPQISLYKHILREHFEEVISSQQIIDSIKYASGEKLNEYLDDIRFHLHGFELNRYLFDNILYMTNGPFDEIATNFKIFEPNNEILERCREQFMKKIKNSKTEDTITKEMLNDQIQRKMNPVNDLTEPHNLIIYPTEEKSAEMFVIASLIDKIPNLGGIARTCEVLGIQNLVMSSKMDTEKSDFKNLSMTAEKSLNIIEVKPKDLREFLMNKKLQGFSIVGAEQTNNSQNFNDFKFPQKSVLLLGHEKDGIPAPLLGLLDYAVEIPQFGKVRSLNVHVTGALFMWEFCKQHLIKS